MVIALVGMCGAGKSTVAQHLEELDFKGVYFGGITLAEIKNKGLELTPVNEKKVREHLRTEYGMDVFAKKSLPAIEKLLKEGKKVYIDGLYSYAEYLFLKRELAEELVVVEVYANKSVRKLRLASRKLRPLTSLEVDERDRSEIELLDKAPPIALSDFKIANNANSESTKVDLKKILEIVKST